LLSRSQARPSFLHESLNQLWRRGQEPCDHNSYHDLRPVPEEPPINISSGRRHCRNRSRNSQHHKDDSAPACPILQPVKSPRYQRPPCAHGDRGLRSIQFSSISNTRGTRHGERSRHQELSRADYDQIRGNQEKQNSDRRHTRRTFPHATFQNPMFHQEKLNRGQREIILPHLLDHPIRPIGRCATR